MTAWTGITVMSIIVANSCMDIVGLEYGTKYQIFSDYNFSILAGFMFGWAFIVDTANFFRRKKYCG